MFIGGKDEEVLIPSYDNLNSISLTCHNIYEMIIYPFNYPIELQSLIVLYNDSYNVKPCLKCNKTIKENFTSFSFYCGRAPLFKSISNKLSRNK